MWEEAQQERDHFEERCSALELELRSMSNQHDDEVERMRQDVMTAVSAIRANEEESETQLSDKVQLLTKQMSQQKDKYMVGGMCVCVCGGGGGVQAFVYVSLCVCMCAYIIVWMFSYLCVFVCVGCGWCAPVR